MIFRQNIQVRIAKESDRQLWNTFVENHPLATPYHLWEFGTALSDAYGYARYYLIAENSYSVVGVFPLIYIKSALFGNKLISLPFCEYGGPLVDHFTKSSKTIEKVLLFSALTLASNLDVDYVEIRNPSLSVHANDVLRLGYIRRSAYVTFHINLEQGLTSLFQNLKSNIRRPLRKALSNKLLSIISVTNYDALACLYDLYLCAQKKHGTPPHSYTLFRKLFNSFNNSDKVKMLIVVHDGEPIAGFIFWFFNKKIYYWMGFLRYEKRHLYPTHLAFWYAIEYGIKNRFTTFDLGRTRKNDPIYFFKSRWMGVEKPLVDYLYFRSERRNLPDPAQKKYRILSNFWSLLPLAVSKHLGPKVIRCIGL